jgi:hypothetical protein
VTQRLPTLPKLALVLILLLGSISLLGATSETPRLEIAQISSVDDGTSVVVSGVLVDFRSYDAGVENLVLMDSRSGATVKIACYKGIGAPPSQYAAIGDELLIRGEVSQYKSSPTVFTDNEGISVLKKAEFVLTVELLAANWALFEGDEFVIRGVMMQSGHRLYDHNLEHSIMVISDGLSVSQFDDRGVLVTCELQYDESIMALTLVVESVRIDA